MRPIHRLCLLLMILMLGVAACVPQATPVANQAAVDVAVQATLTAYAIFSAATNATLPMVATVTPMPAATQSVEPPTSLELFSATPVPTLTGTIQPPIPPGPPLVSVSLATNCRSGPARSHDWLGGLYPGQSAKVVGKYPDLNYWIIENPSGVGTCWLWGGYATVTGDITNLPVWPAPTQPAMPMLTAKIKTACRSAPSDSYERVGSLDVGESAEIVGRTTGSNWWLIANPDAAGSCWVEGSDAKITGNIYALAIIPTPQGVPVGTNTPTPTPTLGSSEEFSCRLVSVKPKNGASFAPGSDFDAIWTVKNIGSKSWKPAEVDYRYLSGTKMHASKLYDLNTTVRPDDTVEITVAMTAPDTTGSYSTTWALARGSVRFCELSLTINVKK